MRSLVWATDVDVLPGDREVTRRDIFWVVRCPSNPGFYWGNLLVFDAPPAPGDRDRWLAAFAAEFPDLGHRTFAWDVTDASVGQAAQEFPDFELEQMVGLIATPGELAAHPRAHPDVSVRALDPGGDEALWRQIVEIRELNNAMAADPLPAAEYRTFSLSRQRDLRGLLNAGRGAWYVALEGELVVGSLGVVVTDGRARYQSVDTRDTHRRRGIASRLVIEAAQRTEADFGPLSSLVIAADADYHALGLYESLGFAPVERVSGVWRRPPVSAQ